MNLIHPSAKSVISITTVCHTRSESYFFFSVIHVSALQAWKLKAISDRKEEEEKINNNKAPRLNLEIITFYLENPSRLNPLRSFSFSLVVCATYRSLAAMDITCIFVRAHKVSNADLAWSVLHTVAALAFTVPITRIISRREREREEGARQESLFYSRSFLSYYTQGSSGTEVDDARGEMQGAASRKKTTTKHNSVKEKKKKERPQIHEW